MATYNVTTGPEITYSVTIDDDGIVEVDGLLPETAENLKASVLRHTERHKLPVITALGLAVGPYSTVTEADPQA